MGRPCQCCKTNPNYGSGETCCLYFVATGFTGLCSQLNGIWELYPYAATVGSTPYWKPYNPNPGNTTSVLNWYAWRDVTTGIFYLYIAYGLNLYGLGTGLGALGDYMPKNAGWRLINSYKMCDLSSFVVTIADPTLVPCNGYSSPPSITMTPIACCRDCYSINLPFTDVKYFETVFPTGENVEIDGYGNMTGFHTSFGPLGGGSFQFPNEVFAYTTAFDSCCYHGVFTDISGNAQAEFALGYMLSSNQAVMRITLMNVVHGTGGNTYRWYVSLNFDPSAGGDFYLSALLDDGGFAALADSNWRTSWNSVSAFNAAYPPGDFSNILSDTWPNMISAAAPANCHGYYAYTPPPPTCSGNCNYVAVNIAPIGYIGSNTGTTGEFVVWWVEYGYGLEPTCAAGCGCFPFTSPTTVPFDATTFSRYLTFCDLHSYPNAIGERLETGCV